MRHAGCILVLMWMGLLNGQPFLFADTTSYVRAGDLVAVLVTHGHLRTEWTDRYSGDLRALAGTRPAAPSAPPRVAAGNDIASGSVMSGRSPYFGVLLYASYLASDFWLFVLAQAGTAYGLILLGMRHFGVDRPRQVVGVVLLLALATSLPYYVALLLADALAGFGVVAFLLLLTDRGEFALAPRLFAWAVLIASVVSHLTHIVMLAGMIGLLVLLRLAGKAPRLPWRALIPGIVCVAIGLASVMLTAAVVTRVMGKPPALVPLMTARFIADGPGERFIADGCGGRAFAACRLTHGSHPNSALFLWSHDPANGVFLTASPADRAALSAEDTRFALAVLRAYPLEQGGMILWNSVRQLLTFADDGLNQNCGPASDCLSALPPRTHARFDRSLSGRALWPDRLMTGILYAAVALSAAVLAVRLRRVARGGPRGADLALWVVLVLTAMLICAVFGGAISEPQYRYQGRLIWMLPYLAALTILVGRRSAGGATLNSVAGRPMFGGTRKDPQ